MSEASQPDPSLDKPFDYDSARSEPDDLDWNVRHKLDVMHDESFTAMRSFEAGVQSGEIESVGDVAEGLARFTSAENANDSDPEIFFSVERHTGKDGVERPIAMISKRFDEMAPTELNVFGSHRGLSEGVKHLLDRGLTGGLDVIEDEDLGIITLTLPIGIDTIEKIYQNNGYEVPPALNNAIGEFVSLQDDSHQVIIEGLGSSAINTEVGADLAD